MTPAETDSDTEPKTDPNEAGANGAENDSALINECRIDSNYLFSMVLSPAALLAQQHRHKHSFLVLADLLTALIKNDLMTISFINQQCVKLLRQEWDQVSACCIRFAKRIGIECRILKNIFFSPSFEQMALNHVAVTIQAVIDNCAQLINDESEALFLEMLADLIRDMDQMTY